MDKVRSGTGEMPAISIDYDLVDRIIAANRSITTMESCTGGALVSALTNRSGASDIIKGAFVTYSNEAKIQQGVPQEFIDAYGVYSMPTAEAMAHACARAYDAQIGVGITGSLGRKDPNNPDSHVGQVYYSICSDDGFSTKMIEVPTQLQERADMKRYVVNRILGELAEMV